MAATWTVKDSSGQVLDRFNAPSRTEVGRKLLPTRYDAFRLEVSASYRELFDRALAGVLERERWQIVRVVGRSNPFACSRTTPMRNDGEGYGAILA